MLHTVTSSRWCTDTIFWHESCFRRFTIDHCYLQFIDAFCSRNSLWIYDCASQYTGCRECKYFSYQKRRIYDKSTSKEFYTRILQSFKTSPLYLCLGTHVARDVRHCRTLDPASGEVTFHVFLPRWVPSSLVHCSENSTRTPPEIENYRNLNFNSVWSSFFLFFFFFFFPFSVFVSTIWIMTNTVWRFFQNRRSGSSNEKHILSYKKREKDKRKVLLFSVKIHGSTYTHIIRIIIYVDFVSRKERFFHFLLWLLFKLHLVAFAGTRGILNSNRSTAWERPEYTSSW